MLGTYISHNGQLIPKEEALVSIDNIEFTYGFGVYENIRLSKGKLMFVDLHIERLMNSAKIIHLEHIFDIQDIKRDIQILVEKNKISQASRRPASGGETANIKILLIGGKTPADAQLYIMMLAPKFLDKKVYREGVKVISKTHERFLPIAKTLNMLPSYLFYKDAAQKGAFDALLLDHLGNILEGTRSNFFAIRDTTLYTPLLEHVLNGVTRQTVIACAREHGYTVREEMISFSTLFSFDGAFLTNTSGKIVPIRTVDGQTFPEIASEIKRLIKLYDEYLNC